MLNCTHWASCGEEELRLRPKPQRALVLVGVNVLTLGKSCDYNTHFKAEEAEPGVTEAILLCVEGEVLDLTRSCPTHMQLRSRSLQSVQGAICDRAWQ